MRRCGSHSEGFHGDSRTYVCPVCGLGLMVLRHHTSDAVTVIVHPPRKWLAQLFFDLARWLEW